MDTMIINARVILPNRILPNGCVHLSNGCICQISETTQTPPQNCTVIDASGSYLSPGFIDIHVHGGGGYEFMGASPDTIRQICAAHARYGTTSILPTTLAAPMEDILSTIDAVRAAQTITTECNILGMHLEGPYFAKTQSGAQNPAHIVTPLAVPYTQLLDRWDQIRIVGAAPELDGGLALGQELHRRGIVASIAHSDADFDQVTAAMEHGYTDVTHIYSGCSMVHRVNGYRVAGIVEAGLLRDDLTVQVIADGKHLPSSLLKLIYKCKGADRISLITDALFAAAANYPEGELITQQNGMQTILEDGVMKLPDRQAFAGSIATTAGLVRNMVQLADVPLPEAVRMASMTPARLIGADRRKGRIAAGYDADLLLLDEQLEVRMTMVMGHVVYNNLTECEQ